MGTDTIIFGLMGSLLSFFICNWKAIKALSNNNNSIFCFLCIFVFLIVIMGFSNNVVFRLAAIVNGLLVGFVFSRKLDTGENASESMPRTGWRRFINLTVISACLYVVINIIVIIVLFV